MPVADPSLPVQKAIVAALKTDPTVAAMINGRIYDAVPLNAVKPYVSFGGFDLLPELGDCLDGAAVAVTLDAWAAGPDTVQIKRLGSAVAAVLDEAELVLDENQRLVELTIERIQYLRDPDGITAHAVLSLEAHCEPTDVAAPDVTPPTITSLSSGTVPENSVLAHALTANEAVTWSLVGGADLARFELSGVTLRWLGNGVKDFEAPNDADLNNAYVVTVRATDLASNTADQTVTITVTDVADAGGPPMLRFDDPLNSQLLALLEEF